MHELSLCRSIFSIVDRARAGRTVETIHVMVGQRRQVVPRTLEYCWSLLTEQSALQGSELAIDHVPVRLACNACGETTTEVDALVLVCGGCGGGDVRVAAGEEFIVTTIDVSKERVLTHG